VARASSRLDFLPAIQASTSTAFHIVPIASVGNDVNVSTGFGAPAGGRPDISRGCEYWQEADTWVLCWNGLKIAVFPVRFSRIIVNIKRERGEEEGNYSFMITTRSFYDSMGSLLYRII
jgi:hypothetical protein